MDRFFTEYELTNLDYERNIKLKKELSRLIKLFSPIEQEMINLRYGLTDGIPKTIDEISSRLKLDKNYISTSLCDCLRKFRKLSHFSNDNMIIYNYEVNSKLKEELYENFEIFNHLEKVLLSLRFGFNGFEPLPYDVISLIFNRTPGELIQIEMEAIDKYQKYKTI